MSQLRLRPRKVESKKFTFRRMCSAETNFYILCPTPNIRCDKSAIAVGWHLAQTTMQEVNKKKGWIMQDKVRGRDASPQLKERLSSFKALGRARAEPYAWGA
jgi:hypothetical protein